MSDEVDPEVIRKVGYGYQWPEDQPFPLTPLEAWYVLRGWKVRPSSGLTMDQFNALPGKIEGGEGWVELWQC